MRSVEIWDLGDPIDFKQWALASGYDLSTVIGSVTELTAPDGQWVYLYGWNVDYANVDQPERIDVRRVGTHQSMIWTGYKQTREPFTWIAEPKMFLVVPPLGTIRLDISPDRKDATIRMAHRLRGKS